MKRSIKHSYQIPHYLKQIDALEKRQKKCFSKVRQDLIKRMKYEIASFKPSPNDRYVDYRKKQKEKQEFAKKLRDHMTHSEEILWKRVKPLGFFSHQPLLGYIPDFYHYRKRIIVEVDGSIHETEKQKQWDLERDEVFRSRGIFTFRVTNDQVNNDIENVMSQIKKLVTV
jgi:very-short-patch-repair endonuclease